MSLNNITIMGRFTAEPELKYTNSGTAVVGFTLAVDRDFKDANGERGCDFINCTAWRASAEFVAKWFHKGSMAVVNGRLQNRKWQDQNGNNRVSTEVIVENVYFGESAKQKADTASDDDFGGQMMTAAQMVDEDLPF